MRASRVGNGDGRVASLRRVPIAVLVLSLASGVAPGADSSSVARRVLDGINAARVAKGASPLLQTENLRQAATQRARDIAALPYGQRMNRTENIGAFLKRRGIEGVATARERLFMLSGYDDPAAQVLEEWRGYAEAWTSALDPVLRDAGIGWAETGDGYGVFLAIFTEPLKSYADADLVQMEERAFDLVNRERTARGLPALVRDPRIEKIARAHSRDMAARHFFDHVTPDGVTPAKRVERAGLAYREVAENIAENRAMADPAEEAVRGWMASEGHRENILNGRLETAGIGVAMDREGTLFFTQLFYTPAPKDR